MRFGLSKSRLTAYRQCPKRLWLYVHRRELEQHSDETEQRFQIGFQVGEVARGLHPDGVLIEATEPAQALADTRQALADHPDRPLFEAGFERDGVFIRADILLPEPGGYRLREVKASASVKPEHAEDCAIQAWVAGASVTLTGVELAHVDTSFVYPGDGQYQGLLLPEPMDAQVQSLAADVPQWVVAARAMLAGAEPVIAPGPQCTKPYDCPFQAYCTAGQPPEPEYPIGVLPRLGGGRLQALEELGVEDVRDVPDDFALTATQERVARVIKSGVAEFDPGPARFLKDLPYPRYHLDFETFRVAVPLWAGTWPYQKLPVQWSCQVEEAPGRLRHHAFLAEGFGDPRRRLAEELLAVLGEAGPVFVYNQGFEIARLQELADAYPDLAPRLQAIIGRVIDLWPIVRACYCHPAMRGSWSLKLVLPAIAPDLAYDGLEVGAGDEAEAAWGEIFHPDTPEERRATLRAALAKYCRLDTLATVRLACFLQGIAPPAAVL